MKKILLRFDDACPMMNYNQWDKAISLVKKFKVNALICVVPDCKDPDLIKGNENVHFWEEIRELQANGFTIAMHGHQHVCKSKHRGLISLRKWSEFSGLSYDEQFSSLEKGLTIMRGHGIETNIFVAPSHSYDKNTLKALKALGFKYISDGKTTKPIEKCGIVCIPCRSSGVPKIKKNGYYTAIFHPSEWDDEMKEIGYHHLQYILNNYSDCVCDFYSYSNSKSGNIVLQLFIEKNYIFWIMFVKEKISYLLHKIKNTKLFRYFFDQKYRFYVNDILGFYKKMDDAAYLKLKFKHKMGSELKLDHPVTFNEKIQWLKLYDRHPEYSTMVDKLEAKQYVLTKTKINVIKTIGVWKKFNDIDFEALPNRFVLKCTHDSGGLVICKDKTKLDYKKCKKTINKSLKRNYYYSGREWPYKNVRPRIIAEEYMEDDSGSGLIDYKFYCFNGEPKFLYISKGLDNHATASISFLKLDWSPASFKRSDYKQFEKLPEKPSCFNEMIEIAKNLSKNVIFLRVDLYQIKDKVYFSELTFSPCGGFMPFEEKTSDIELGNMLRLPIDK